MNFFGPQIMRSFGQVFLPIARQAFGNVIGNVGKIAGQGLMTVAGMGLNALKNYVQGQDGKQTLEQFKNQSRQQFQQIGNLGEKYLKRTAATAIDQLQDQLTKKIFK